MTSTTLLGKVARDCSFAALQSYRGRLSGAGASKLHVVWVHNPMRNLAESGQVYMGVCDRFGVSPVGGLVALERVLKAFVVQRPPAIGTHERESSCSFGVETIREADILWVS